MDAGTISISIGDARFSTCLVLPRSHELVRHIQSLLPANALAQQDQARSTYSPSSALADLHLGHPSRSQVSAHPVQQRTPAGPHSTPPPVSSLAGPHRSAAVIQSLLHRPISPDTGRRAVQTRGTSSTSRKKRCQVADCGKISVSQGLCRAHGGGRRCGVEGCTKSAQSRGDYCWSHGGGHRCEVPGCMRSRKTKRFCNAHVNCGSDATQSFPRRLAAREAASAPVAPVEPSPVPARPMETFTNQPRLPSLHHALQPFSREQSPLRDFRPGTSQGFRC